MGESSRETSSTKIAPKGSQGQLRGRKLAGQKDGGSLHYAIGAAEDDIVIRQRLLTRTTTTRGEPPLKKLLKKFVLFANEIEKEGDNYGECEKLCKAFLLELGTFEFPLLKTKSVIDASKREQENFKELRNKLDKEISQAAKDIEELKVLLEESKIERQHKEECEVIRRLISAQPTRSHTQKAIDDLESEIAILESQNLEALKTLELRKKQFALLLHVVDDLQCAMEVSKPLVDDLKSGDDDKLEMEQENALSLPAILAEAMQID